MTYDYDDFDDLTPVQSFFSKMDSEGGPYGALQYGLRAEDFDVHPMMVVHWDEVRDMFNDMQHAVDDFLAKWERSGG